MRRLLTGLLIAPLLLGACDDDAADESAAVTSIPDETSTSTTSTTEPAVPPPDVIPSDPSLITEEYVEQVLDALYEVSLEAIELARAEGAVGDASMALIEATSTEALARARTNSLLEDLSAGFPDYPASLRPVDATVVRVVESGPTCIFAEATFDSTGISTRPNNSSEFTVFARLLAATEEQVFSGLNPTAWVLDGLPATEDGSLPDETCP